MLEDALDEISLKGSMTLKCEGSRFQGVLENYMMFDLVIGFTLATDDIQNQKIYLEPYIFNITEVKQISPPDSLNKMYLISFLDILSYTAMNHSFSSIRKLAKGPLSNAQNYEMLFNTVYDYLISFIERFTLGSFTYDKINFMEKSDVDTSELVKMTIDKIPQTATVLDALKIISYDACTATNMKKERHEEIKKDFELFENDTTALVPLFFKEEYLFNSAVYEAIFDIDDNDKIRDKISKVINASDGGLNVLTRSMFKRNISMPFFFAFDDKNKIIFESLNPDIEEENNKSNTNVQTENIEKSFKCINGQKVSPITSMTTKFIDMKVNNARWKNMIFLYESKDSDSNFLLRFDWIFNFYNRVFLNNRVNKNLITNILPDFYINEKIGLANGSIITEEARKREEEAKAREAAKKAEREAKAAAAAAEAANKGDNNSTDNNTTDADKPTGEITSKKDDVQTPAPATGAGGSTGSAGTETPNSNPSVISSLSEDEDEDKITKTKLYENEFHEYNANTFLIRSENETKEAQYYIGKMLTSFIMLNTTYSYNIEGSLFRRPNEIVKINRHISSLAAHDPNSNAPSGLNGQSKYTMVYVTNVKHYFSGKSFINIVTANKIYDSYA